MERFTEVVMPIVLTFLLLSTQYAHAPGEGQIVVQPVINFDLQGLISSFGQNADNIIGAVGGVPSAVFSLFKAYFEDTIRALDAEMLSFLGEVVSANPDPAPMKGLADTVTAVVSSLYLLVFLAAGFAFLFAGLSPERRHRAKEWLLNALIMVVAVNSSFPVYTIALELSATVTRSAWASVPVSFFLPGMLSGLGAGQLLFFGTSIVFALSTIVLRYLFLLVAAGLFPLGMFLYFTPPLKQWGKAVFSLIGAALAMPIVDTLVFGAAGSMAGAFPAHQGLVPSFAFIAVGIANLAMMVYALLKSAVMPFAPAPNHSHEASGLAQSMHNLGENLNALNSTLSLGQSQAGTPK